ncbi:hypothetical protein G9A89_021108 [Geosiphon pyriformis]|nr:hypothetical protein G9A89_021108 [Geosiphon pyriformis]
MCRYHCERKKAIRNVNETFTSRLSELNDINKASRISTASIIVFAPGPTFKAHTFPGAENRV